MSDTSGPTLPPPLASYDPETCSWRTSEDIFGEGSTLSSQTLPLWGMTRAGELYGLRTPELPTVESGCSSLLPSPAAMNAANDPGSVESWLARKERQLALGRNGNGMGTPLGIAVQLLKTPTAQLAVNGGSQHPGKRRAGGHGPTLADEVEHLLPTPNAAKAGNDVTLTCSGDGRERPNKLGWAIATLPTPTAMDAHSSGGSTPSNVTLTDAVVRTSLGARMNPRFGDGSPSLDDQLPGQLSLDEPASD